MTPAENTFTDWMAPVVRPVTVMWQGPSLGRSVMLGQDSASASPTLGDGAAVSVWRDTSTGGKTILSSVCLVTAIGLGPSMALCSVTNRQDSVPAN